MCSILSDDPILDNYPFAGEYEESNDLTIDMDELRISSPEEMVENKILSQMKILSSIILNSRKEFRQYIIQIGRAYYHSLKKRGAVTLFIGEDDFDTIIEKLRKCQQIFNNNINMDDKDKIRLMWYAFPPVEYCNIGERHLRTHENKNLYDSYDTSVSCILFMGVYVKQPNQVFTYTNIVEV